jgi:hypothetical protein
VWLLRHGDTISDLQGGACPVRSEAIHHYDQKGARGGPELREAIAALVAANRQATLAEHRRGRAVSILALSMFIVGCLPLLMLWSGPTAERLSRVDQGGVSIALIVLGFGLLTWLMLAITAVLNRNAVFLVVVQFVLLAGIIVAGG